MLTSVHLRSNVAVSYGQAGEPGDGKEYEDCIGIRSPEEPARTTKGIVAAIADGVSACDAGREAAETCVKGFALDYYSTPETWTVPTSALRILSPLNSWLRSKGGGRESERGAWVAAFGVLVLKSRSAHVFHAGDVRLHLFRDERLERLTKDHVAYPSRDKKYLARAMGLDADLALDHRQLDARKGDVFLWTTDGVHDYLADEDLAAALSNLGEEPEPTCEAIVREALARGSKDDRSCALLRIDELPPPDADETYRRLTALPFPPDLSPGMKLDGLLVEKILHASPRSQLYLASDESSSKRVVMKTPSVNYEDDPGYVERFTMEEWIARRVDNPHVMKAVDKPRSPSCLYHLFEHVEGITLEEWIEQNPQPSPAEAVEFVAQTAKGLRALHRKEVLHQDLKPGNVVIHRGGTVKLVDLGSCHVPGLREIAHTVSRKRRLGTVSYSAPEYVLGLKPDRRSDQFSLACLAYELLAGKGRHPYGSAYAKVDSQQAFDNLKYDSVCRHNPLVPSWMDGALRKASSTDRAKRYDTLSEFIQDLRRPNPKLAAPADLPLLERNPIAFWKALVVLLALTQAVTLWFLLR